MSRGNVTRRGKDSWRLKYDIAADPITGARRTKFATIRGTKRQAEKELARRISEAENGMNLAPDKLLTGEFIERWLEDTIKPSVRAITFEGYENTARGHLIPYLGMIPLKKLTPMHIQAYHSAKAKDGLSAQTIIHHHRLLFQAMKQAHNARMIAFNPCTAVRPPKRKKNEIPVLSRDELQIFLNALEGSRLYDIAFLAACTGMRRSELLGLRWSDVDLENKSLMIIQTLEETREHGIRIEATKTKSSRRRITLPAAAIHVLQRWRRQQDEEHLKLGLGRDAARLVFTRQDGEWYSPRSISDAFSRAVAKIDGIPKISLHGLRHTHITHLLKDGVNFKAVSARAGHASVSTTLDTYAHLIDNMEVSAADVVDLWFAGVSQD